MADHFTNRRRYILTYFLCRRRVRRRYHRLQVLQGRAANSPETRTGTRHRSGYDSVA